MDSSNDPPYQESTYEKIAPKDSYDSVTMIDDISKDAACTSLSEAATSGCHTRRFRPKFTYYKLLILLPISLWIAWYYFIIPILEGTFLANDYDVFSDSLLTYPHQSLSSSTSITISTLDPKHLPHHRHSSNRLIIVGDIHGCKDSLLGLLAKTSFHPRRDHLILAGDMVDKGPKSNGVIKLARKFGASCVRGNHEDHHLTAFEHMNDEGRAALPGDDEIDESGHEGDDTLFSHKRLSRASLEYLSHCPTVLRVGNLSSLPGELLVVHAGLAPHTQLANQDPYNVMHMRTIDSKTHQPSAKASGKGLVPWWKVWGQEQKKLKREEREVVLYGHNSREGVVEKEYSVGLDSGCVKGGKLSALVIQGPGGKRRKVVSVKCHDKYW